MRNTWLATATEMALVVILSAAIGLIWNRNLLTSAWRGEVTSQAKAPSQAPSPSAAEVQAMPIALAQVKELFDQKQAVLVDARNAASFAEGHIAGAIALPLEQARTRPAQPFKQKLPADSFIITYCNGFSCHDSMDLARILIGAGYTSVYVFEGGYPEWRDAGYPVAKGGV
jgi:rhodanese-related sulfurtransferase